MKIRTGFVSNSSSSSYVLIGKRITEKEAKKAKNPVMIFDSNRFYGSDGMYASKLDKDMVDYICNLAKEEGKLLGELYDAFYFEEDGGDISTQGIPPKVYVTAFERDQYGPVNVKELKDMVTKKGDWNED